MLRWGKRKPPVGAPEPAATAADEWEFLRGRPDFDAEEMASVHARRREERAAAPPPHPSPEPPVAPSGEVGPSLGRPTAFHPALTRWRPRRSAEGAPPGAGTTPAAAPGTALALLVSGGATPRRVPLEGEVLIGRRDPERAIFPHVDLAEDDAVSRRHARIRIEGGRCLLRDLNSLNGTFLNGRRLPPERDVPLRPGDRIELGEAACLEVVEAGAPAPAAAPGAAPDDVLELALRLGAAHGLLSPEPTDTEP